MANTLRIKRRASGSTGAPSSLENAELAFNEADAGDGILYYGKGTGGAGGSASGIIAIGGDGAFVSLSGNQTVSGNKTFTGTVVLPTLSSLATSGNVVVGGNLTVNGTTTEISSSVLNVEDKNIELGKVDTPTDSTADGGGLTLKGATDHTILWTNSTDSWDFSEHVNLASGKEFKINGTSVLSGSTLGSGVTGSSLTSVGTIATGTWNGTAIGIAYGGTGLTATPANGQLAIDFGTHKLIPLKTRFQGKDAAGHHDLLLRNINGNQRWVSNFLNFSVDNFTVREHGSLENIIEHENAQHEIDDQAENDGQLEI